MSVSTASGVQGDQSPLLSVIMPAYNAGRYIGPAIESILAQTFRDFELLICDDGSSDDTLAVCAAYSDPRIKIYENGANQGVLKTFNRLLGLARGRYITLQDADDLSADTRLEMQVKVLETQPETGVVFTNGIFFNDAGQELSGRSGQDQPLDLDSVDVGIPASMMLRASLRDALNGWNPYFDRLTSMDRYYIMELLALAPGYLIGAPLYNARVVAGSNHRSLSTDSRKLVIHNVFEELHRQRLETGTDMLQQQDFAGLAALERRLLADRRLIADNLLVYAIGAIEARQFASYARIAWRIFKKNPLHLKQYRSLLYCFKTMLKRPAPAAT